MMTSLKLLLTSAVFAVAVLACSTDAQAGRHCCPPPQKVVLVVCHPCTNCTYEIPVCIPACCQGAPAVCFQDTVIGYGRNVFEWTNGYRVVVRFPPGGGYRVVQRKV
jgi:hypothetical protein